jgi:type II secretory pathway pseudopilin PulG
MNQEKQQEGFIMVMLLGLIIVMSIVGISLTLIITSNVSRAVTNEESQRALNASEAGINYYLWHLSHNPSDFKDGQSTPATPDATLGYGPYTHDYIDGKR